MDIDTFMDIAENPNNYNEYPEFVEIGEDGKVVKYSTLSPDIMDSGKVVIKSFQFDHVSGSAFHQRSIGFNIPGDEFDLADFVNNTAGPIDRWDTNIINEILDEDQARVVRNTMEASNLVEQMIIQGGGSDLTNPPPHPSSPLSPFPRSSLDRTKWLIGGLAAGIITTLTITGLVTKWMIRVDKGN